MTTVNWMGWGIGDKVKNLSNGKIGKIIRLDSHSALVEYEDNGRENVPLKNLEVLEYFW